MASNQPDPYTAYALGQLEEQAFGHNPNSDPAKQKQSRMRDCTYKVIPLFATLTISFSAGGVLTLTLAYDMPMPRNGVIAVSVILGILAFFWISGRLMIYRDHHYTHVSRLERARALLRWARCNGDQSITNMVLESRPNYGQVPAHGRVRPATPSPPPRTITQQRPQQRPDARNQQQQQHQHHHNGQPVPATVPTPQQMNCVYPSISHISQASPVIEPPRATLAPPQPTANRAGRPPRDPTAPHEAHRQPERNPQPAAAALNTSREPVPAVSSRGSAAPQPAYIPYRRSAEHPLPGGLSSQHPPLQTHLVLHPSALGSQVFRELEEQEQAEAQAQEKEARRLLLLAGPPFGSAVWTAAPAAGDGAQGRQDDMDDMAIGVRSSSSSSSPILAPVDAHATGTPADLGAASAASAASPPPHPRLSRGPVRRAALRGPTGQVGRLRSVRAELEGSEGTVTTTPASSPGRASAAAASAPNTKTHRTYKTKRAKKGGRRTPPQFPLLRAAENSGSGADGSARPKKAEAGRQKTGSKMSSVHAMGYRSRQGGGRRLLEQLSSAGGCQEGSGGGSQNGDEDESCPSLTTSSSDGPPSDEPPEL